MLTFDTVFLSEFRGRITSTRSFHLKTTSWEIITTGEQICQWLLSILELTWSGTNITNFSIDVIFDFKTHFLASPSEVFFKRIKYYPSDLKTKYVIGKSRIICSLSQKNLYHQNVKWCWFIKGASFCEAAKTLLPVMTFKVSSKILFKAPWMKMSRLVIWMTHRDNWAVTQIRYVSCLSPVEALQRHESQSLVNIEAQIEIKVCGIR